MALAAQVQRHVLHQHLAHEGVHEAQAATRRVDDGGVDRRVQGLLDLGVADARHLGHQRRSISAR